MVREILGLIFCVLGWLGIMLACGLPMWKVTAFVEHVIVTQTVWEGLWMNCVAQSTGQIECKVYDSMLALSGDLQAGRVLTVLACLVGCLGLLLTILGAQCTTCLQGNSNKSKLAAVGGMTYVLCGILVLIPLCWMANKIIRDFYDPVVPKSNKRDMGAALYIGWTATALLLVGGMLLFCSCPAKTRNTFSVKYSAASKPSSNGEYDKKNYV